MVWKILSKKSRQKKKSCPNNLNQKILPEKYCFRNPMQKFCSNNLIISPQTSYSKKYQGRHCRRSWSCLDFGELYALAAEAAAAAHFHCCKVLPEILGGAPEYHPKKSCPNTLVQKVIWDTKSSDCTAQLLPLVLTRPL